MQNYSGYTGLILFFLFLLGGCSQTPNMQTWSENSLALKQSVNQINSDVLMTTDATLQALENGKNNEDWQVISLERIDAWKQRRQTLSEAMIKIDAGLSAMVVYADTLSQLAASGETGREAADSVFNSLSSLEKTLGALYPPALIAGEGFKALSQEIMAIATTVQAQGELASGMKRAQKHVDGLALQLKSASFSLIELLGPIASVQETAVLGKYGQNRIAFYQNQSSYAQIEALFAEGDSEKLKNTLDALEKLSEHYRAYQHEIANIRQWRDTRMQQILSIASAIDVWALSHAQAQSYLARCGGFKSLKPACGNFTAANVTDAKNRIEALRSKL